MRGNVVCFIAPATFLTSLGLIEAAMTRTKAVLSSRAGAGMSTSLRTEGSPKASNRIARMICSLRSSFGCGRGRLHNRANRGELIGGQGLFREQEAGAFV